MTKKYYDINQIKNIDSVNLLGLYLSLNDLRAMTDIKDNHILGIIKLNTIKEFLHDDDKPMVDDIIENVLLLRISRSRQGRKEILKLSKLSKNIVSIFQRKKTEIGGQV